MISTKRTTVLALLVLSASLVYSAPYCVVTSFGKQCYYYSWKECEKAAGGQGACVINQEEAKAPSGSAPFCVVASYGTQCFYYDTKSCNKAAAAANAVCAVNPDR